MASARARRRLAGRSRQRRIGLRAGDRIMNIGTVAEKLGIPQKTIRCYEHKRLIRKADQRANG